MEALAGEMEKMFFEMESHRDPSSSAEGAGASGANAGDDSEAAREMEIRAAWEDLFAERMADIPTVAAAGGGGGGGGGGQSNAPRGSKKDAFQRIRDEAAERLRQSNAEQQVVTGSHIVGRRPVHANSPNFYRRVLPQMMTSPLCLTRGMMPQCK